MQITFDLIERYARGTATPEEQAFVNDWLENGDENELVSTAAEDEILHLEPRKNFRLSRFLYQSVAWIALVAAILVLHRSRNQASPGEEHWITRTNPAYHIRELVLPDGSSAVLAPGAEISLSDQFGKNNRKLVVNQGTVFLDVVSDSTNPLLVSIGQDIIEVPGTRIEVCADRKNVQATLLTGKILYRVRGKETILLNPGQQLNHDAESGLISVAPTDTLLVSSWRTGALIFNETPLPEVIRAIEKKFDIRLVSSSEELGKLHYSGSFLNELPGRIAEILFEATGIRFEIQE